MTSVLDTRETRGGAREIKFVIDLARAAGITEWARARLHPDAYGDGEHGDEYLTTSLYFDTAGLDVFRRNGSYARSKYRIRRYGASEVVFLERKLRTPKLVVKRRSLVDRSALSRLTAPDDGTWPGRWFARRVTARRLAPVCQIAYQRIARLAMTDNGPIRLTLDSGLAAQRVSTLDYSPEPGVRVLPEDVILELKFQSEMPALFKDLAERFVLVPRRISKYRLSQRVLSQSEVGDPCRTR